MPRLTAHDRRTHSAERRRQILRAAARVFADRGYATATIENVARAAHVAEGTIYNYFRSKDLLIHTGHMRGRCSAVCGASRGRHGRGGRASPDCHG
jgi:AcrR family transcriptional regulator